ncbi:tryptophan 2,3-dioxygenase family protein [Streptomyces sp. NPDC059009]|uniref:tryptophan 2,3-dioxygenase family protein n=1 Tax=Streptomyces sp. NPDC059009 TaxID=3346694 RepID=UPI00367CC628
MHEATYGTYLNLPQLLSLQVPSAAHVHDERLFITVHQVQELWFAQLLAELTDARDAMQDGDPRQARARLARSLTIVRSLITGLTPLRTMPPAAFHAFRGELGTASGAQSAQFHEIEAVYGAQWCQDRPIPSGLSDEEQERLRRRRSDPTLWDAFLALLRKSGFEVETAAGRQTTCIRLTENLAPHTPEPTPDLPGPDDLTELADLADLLIEHDEIWSEWRTGHTLLVERQIGARQGTGGSTGIPYLRAGIHRRFFPELWEARGLLTVGRKEADVSARSTLWPRHA